MKPRPGEKVGGGFFVFRRGKKTGRVSVRPGTLPFEHADFYAAKAEAQRLAKKHPGEKFVVVAQVEGFEAVHNPVGDE
jgi:hypothetical protein